MRRVPWTWVGALAGVAVLFLAAAWADLDGRVTGVFYTKVGEEPWPQGNHWFWKLADAYGELPGALVGLWAGALLLVRRRRLSDEQRRRCWIQFLLVLLGVGLVVHGLRLTWGRPRPRNVLHWSEPVSYREWWQPAGPSSGRSFPSGHVAISVTLVAGAWMGFRRRRRAVRLAAVGLALAYASLITLSRILDGAHYATDTLWSWVLVLGMWRLLERVVPRGPPSAVRGAPDPG